VVTVGRGAGREVRTTGIDRNNRSAWSDKRVLHEFAAGEASPRSGWWSDPGERAAFLWIASRVRGQPVLDVGVGGGRTVPILRLMTDDYLGIDYTPAMVDLCREAFPGVDVRVADARDLAPLPSEQFGLVVFSFNGLDAIDHDDRSAALREFFRVLRPGGDLLFSTHNKEGPAFNATPWHRAGPPQGPGWPASYRIARFVGGIMLNPLHYPRSVSNWRRLHAQAVDAGDWGIGPVEAHDFDLLIHFTTLAAEVRELEEIGFSVSAVFDAERGRVRQVDDDLTDVRYFHIVASKPAA
jgi:SAM-dependent methyltransferase